MFVGFSVLSFFFIKYVYVLYKCGYSTVTDLAKFLGMSTLSPFNTAM